MSGPRENTHQTAEMLLRLFGHWRLTLSQQLTVLGLSDTSDTELGKYLKHSFSIDRDKLERANILLGIHKSLRVLFPQNRDLAYRWISQPNKAFDGLPPLKVIERQGMLGMYMVRDYLDQYGATEGLTIEALIEGSPDVKLMRSEKEWIDEVPVGRELPDGDRNFKNEEICAMLDVWTAVLRVFENENHAKHWIKTIVPALGCTPIVLLPRKDGRERIMDVLKRIERSDFG
ncbi:DUF2384 domain-containing protein [Microbulbifer sp. SH-1]|uniref:MbcA/ParS/Xre antitoxin family protein n=1 Tax=Microbulbifer sp. SH-1 TaxID=2681547 RepID=UPI00140D0515|nr:MbcA/ParS/Xre antitoxin family protein [Microbulbifer sp. SH-1]QIL91264.1 DUF2384 domain-containing protein [Microbulbifer sp. SH-1]